MREPPTIEFQHPAIGLATISAPWLWGSLGHRRQTGTSVVREHRHPGALAVRDVVVSIGNLGPWSCGSIGTSVTLLCWSLGRRRRRGPPVPREHRVPSAQGTSSFLCRANADFMNCKFIALPREASHKISRPSGSYPNFKDFLDIFPIPDFSKFFCREFGPQIWHACFSYYCWTPKKISAQNSKGKWPNQKSVPVSDILMSTGSVSIKSI